MYRQECVDTPCRALLCISLQALGRASMRVLGSVRLFLNVPKHAGFRSESCGIGSLSYFLRDFRPRADSDDAFVDAVREHRILVTPYVGVPEASLLSIKYGLASFRPKSFLLPIPHISCAHNGSFLPLRVLF